MKSIEIRNAREDEVQAAAEVLNEHSRRLHGTDDMTAAELEQGWRAPEVEFPADVFVAERDGSLVGYADVIPFGETAWLDVRATDSASYDPLIERAAQRAAQHDRPRVRGWASDKDRAAHEAYERVGFRPFRYSFRMEIDLAATDAEPEWPDEFSVRPFVEGDERRVHQMHMESFADTWEFTTEPFETWSHWYMGEGFDPEHWFLVETGDALAGIALCRISETEPDLGFVRILGVKPEYRRRGLALALLRHVFRHFAGLGLQRVGLGVDAENPTGAVSLYERAGMHVSRRDVRYERVPR